MINKNSTYARIRIWSIALAVLMGLAQVLFVSAQPAGAQPAAKAQKVLVLPNHAPEDFIQVRPGIPKGKLETITYNSKSIGVDRKAVVYLPPIYDPGK
jgi:enterochelin esterase-like enzyme